MAKISIIVPVYNVEQWLERCIDSIVAQTYTDWELLLVDDGSTDQSGAICDRYAASDPRIKALHKANGGACSARNLGIDNAKGEWIIVLDSDDYWHLDSALQQLLDTAIKNDVDIVRGEYKAVDQNGNTLFERPIDESKREIQGKVLDTATFAKNAICGEFFFVLCLVKRSAMENIRYDESMRFLEDMKLLAHLLAKPLKCMYIPLRFYSYRKLQTSASNVPKVKNLSDSFAMCDDFWTLAETDNEKLSAFYRYYSVMMYYWTLYTVSETPYYPNREQIINDLCLKQLHNRTVKRLSKCKFLGIYYLFILPSPNVGAMLLRLKNKIAVNVYKLIRQ